MNIFHISDIGKKFTRFNPKDTILTMEWEFLTVEQTQTITWFGSEEFGKFFSLN